ncbi:hypothetical protein [Parvibaculum sp.]|uniref:hypothetical protein n=1 Tax=Parvibaculum sp. TaxID=2024848 RepID=UPI002CF50C9A|nr:hypothetical protein [Parvibaculum sp.]HUD52789.1 hypothetical protein [Parvibaculum sp.]
MALLDQPITAPAGTLLLLAALGAVILLNVWYWGERWRMTSDERRADDEEAEQDRIPGDW